MGGHGVNSIDRIIGYRFLALNMRDAVFEIANLAMMHKRVCMLENSLIT